MPGNCIFLNCCSCYDMLGGKLYLLFSAGLMISHNWLELLWLIGEKVCHLSHQYANFLTWFPGHGFSRFECAIYRNLFSVVPLRTSSQILSIVNLTVCKSCLTGVILRNHRLGDDVSQGVHPLLSLPLLLTHEDELAVWCLHCHPTLPFISSGPLRHTLTNRVPMILCPNENDPKLHSILDNKM